MEKKLIMKFKDNLDKKVPITITEIKEDITKEEVVALMDTILQKHQVFDLKAPLVAKVSADIEDKTVNEIYTA
ncbi:hypothetical protein BD780_000925 [Clostridium tetanomorphum]|uniref:DUF2922 domain-containing protein n=1 Tax=Clostridium tetanomorphum TaxID=1553 RepID=A0A923EAQ3_CLOTT|nr:DUF2922 domain-containing protein [Clostridium tetanomorphum]KAJ50138.1 hypothetical protein CTM_18809 [Clostridium tetanomorphum DSM 665]KAJ50923.1 hypothetical protein CTM_15443 [Clostridium tetanomorphum DSM 665]MBC2399767.1 DUF2922 domain-containing protein [Clostridium tetanomorphum]MBP1864253.1 hypothetical protein [Clostridium tetanomorphum]NRS83700.1 hypothetical protein [Clostridium tetanomorphum]